MGGIPNQESKLFAAGWACAMSANPPDSVAYMIRQAVPYQLESRVARLCLRFFRI